MTYIVMSFPTFFYELWCKLMHSLATDCYNLSFLFLQLVITAQPIRPVQLFVSILITALKAPTDVYSAHLDTSQWM